jgi:putative transposase
LAISDADREQLDAMVRPHSRPHALVRRARIVLLWGEGKSNREVARRCGVTAPTVSHWRRRYQQRGLAGLHDELRPGRPRTHDDEQVAELIRLVTQRKPEHATRWSARSAAHAGGISKSTVVRYFALFGLSRIAPRASSSPRIRSSLRRCVTLWVCISIRPIRHWAVR